MSERDYTAQNEMVMRKWEREEERKRAKAEASVNTMTETLAASLKDINQKKALAREAKRAIDNPDNRHKQLMSQATGGLSRALEDEDKITGFEDTPWNN
jgi:lysozyme family protein